MCSSFIVCDSSSFINSQFDIHLEFIYFAGWNLNIIVVVQFGLLNNFHQDIANRRASLS